MPCLQAMGRVERGPETLRNLHQGDPTEVLSREGDEELSSDSNHSIHWDGEDVQLPEDESSASDSGDSLPPLQFVTHGTQQKVEEIGPGDLVKLVNLQMAGLNEQQGYVLKLTSAEGYKEERVEVKMLSTGNLLSVKRSNVRFCAKAEEHSASLRTSDEAVQGLTEEDQETETKLEDEEDVSVPDAPPDPTLQKSFEAANVQEFCLGDRVRVRSTTLCKAFAGRAGRVVPMEGTAEDRLMIELDQGDRLSFKIVDLEKCEDFQSSKEEDESSASDSGDSLPPLQFVTHGTQQKVEEIGPGDLVKLVNLQMAGLNEQQGYVLKLTSAEGYKEERVEVKMLSTGNLLSVKRSNVRFCAKAEEHSASLRTSDEAVQGLTEEDQETETKLEDEEDVSVPDAPPDPTLQKSFEAANVQEFCLGDRVRVRSTTLCKAFAGRAGRVVPMEGTAEDRLMIELDQGDRLSFKIVDLEKCEDFQSHKEEDESSASDSGDSLPPLEFIKDGTKQKVEEIGPGDLVKLVNLQMVGLNEQQGYVLRLTSGEGYKEERVEVKMLSTGKLLSVKRSNVKSCAAEAEDRPPKRSGGSAVASSRRISLRKGDEVIVQGLTKAFEYNGQRALVLDTGPDNADSDGTPESVPRRVTVELMRSGQRMSLRRDKLRFVQTETDSEASDYADMPQLRCIRKVQTSKFQIGQKVWLHLKQNPEYHGQAVFVLPSDPVKVAAGNGRVTVQLATGKRLVTKESNLRDKPPEVKTSEKNDLQRKKRPKSEKKTSSNHR